MIYDIFLVSSGKIFDSQFSKVRERFPTIQKVEYVKSIRDVKKKSFTKFFWIVWDDVCISNDFDFSYRISKHDEQYIHVFKNILNGESSYVNGICLIPKDSDITDKEFKHRFFVSKKEIDVTASSSRYPIFSINSYHEYEDIVENLSTDMFWAIWPNTEIIDEKIFDMYYDPLDGTYDYDRSENHVWKNLCNDEESYISGLTLFSKSKVVSKREIEYRMLINRKEHDQVATRFRYPRYNIDTYEDYLSAIEKSTTDMFWVLPNDITVTDNSIYDLFFDQRSGQYDHDRKENHVFKNGNYYDGIFLLSKYKKITRKEFDNRFPIARKEWDKVVSKPKDYDIIFISYNEPNADKNFNLLKEKYPRAKRVHGVKGIHQAHLEAAKLSETDIFWAVDGDAQIEENFNFTTEYYPYYDAGNRERFLKTVKIYHSKNPINELEYGYGGVKLLPKDLTMNMKLDTTDMTTSISKSLEIVPVVSNYTMFNTDPFNTWKSAFRECAKLSSKIIDRSYDEETEKRLEVWCTVGHDKPFGEYCIKGAIAGKKYGYRYIGNTLRLSLINDFEWLKQRFEEDCG